MSSMNISLSEDMKAYVDDQVSGRGYSTSSEFVRDLIRQDRERENLRALILKGAASPPGQIADDAWFEARRARIRAHAG